MERNDRQSIASCWMHEFAVDEDEETEEEDGGREDVATDRTRAYP